MPVFVDTSVIVYRFDTSEPGRQRQAERWLEYLWRERRGRVSLQVLHELYVTLTRKLDRVMSPDEARRIVRALFAWEPVRPGRRTIADAWEVEDRFRLSWWDSLILAAAQTGGCRFLLSEDFSDGRDLGGVRVINPFRTAPGELPP